MTERSRLSITKVNEAEWRAYDSQDLAIASIFKNIDSHLVEFGHDLPLEVHGIGLPCHSVIARAKDLDHACARIETFLAIRDNTPILSESEIKTAADEGWTLAVASHKARILKKSSSREPFKTDADAHMHVWEKDQAGDPLCTKALTALIVKDSEFYQAVYEDGIDPFVQMMQMDAQEEVSLEFEDNRSEKERNGLSSAYHISIPQLDESPINVNVLAFDSLDVSAFYHALHEGALYQIDDLPIDAHSLVEKLDWPDGVAARDCTLRLSDGGMPSPMLFGDHDLTDKILQLRASIGYMMKSIKEISEFSCIDKHGSAFLHTNYDEDIQFRAVVRSNLGYLFPGAALSVLRDVNFPDMASITSSPISLANGHGEILLLDCHPALSALNDIASAMHMNKKGSVVIAAKDIDALNRVHQVASMSKTELLAESVKSILATHQLDRFASFSYDEAAIEVLDLADKGELSVDVATMVSRALMTASRFFDVTTEFEMKQGDLLSAQSNRHDSEPTF